MSHAGESCLVSLDDTDYMSSNKLINHFVRVNVFTQDITNYIYAVPNLYHSVAIWEH